MHRARERLAFALDVSDGMQARAWIDRLGGRVGVFKVGLELFIAAGPDVISAVRDVGARVFLDLKLHDIPETVARAVTAARRHEVEILSVHALGGAAMLTRAVDAACRPAVEPPVGLLAVTVLTSMDDEQLVAVGLVGGACESAMRLGALAVEAGVGGLVCSPLEVHTLRARFPRLLLVTPGIRPAGSDRGDQSRVATAGDAVRAGADLLVVGRPIRDAAHPEAVVAALLDEIEAAG